MGVRIRKQKSGKYKVKSRNDEKSNTGCGIKTCQPSLLQKCASPGIFMVLLSVSMCIVACLAMGYMTGVLSTIQKRYHLTSPQTDWIAASYGVGTLLPIIFVGYFGHYGHRPVIIGVGLLLCATGGFLASLPHFVLPSLHDDPTWLAHINRSIQTEFCHVTNDISKDNYCAGDQIQDNGHAQSVTTALVSIGLLICGAGMSPLLTLGTTYIDDAIGRHNTALYLGVVAASLALGPCIGFVVGAAIVTTHHVEFNTMTTQDQTVTPNHPYWIGAWWLGFIIFSAILVILSFPFFLFPKNFAKPSGKKGRLRFTFTHVEDSTGILKEFPGTLKSLFCNRMLMAICIGAGAELAVNTGIMMHLPHYLETQMQASELFASVLTAAVMVPMACLGIFFGGFLIKKMKLSTKKCARVIMYADLTTILVYFFLFLFGCNTQFLPDIFFPSSNNSTNRNIQIIDNKTNLLAVNLTMGCNYQCDCDTQEFHPVCGSNGVTYYSPCYAGCSIKDVGFVDGANGQPVKKYSNCTCVGETLPDESDVDNFYVHGGVCDNHCASILPFTVTFFGIACFASNIPWIPAIMLVLRTMPQKDRSISVAVEYMFMHIFGFILAPLLLMSVVESTCFLRHMVCGEGDVCMAYDILSYRYAFLTMAAALKFLAFCCFMATASFIQAEYKLKRRRAVAASAAATAAKLNENYTPDVKPERDVTDAPSDWKDERDEVFEDERLAESHEHDLDTEDKNYHVYTIKELEPHSYKPRDERKEVVLDGPDSGGRVASDTNDDIPFMDNQTKYRNTRFEVVMLGEDKDGKKHDKGPNEIKTEAEVNHCIPESPKQRWWREDSSTPTFPPKVKVSSV
ncbi:solute carrier organic anion transporter family member 1A4-like [Glandiceps talaboti]